MDDKIQFANQMEKLTTSSPATNDFLNQKSSTFWKTSPPAWKSNKCGGEKWICACVCCCAYWCASILCKTEENEQVLFLCSCRLFVAFVTSEKYGEINTSMSTRESTNQSSLQSEANQNGGLRTQLSEAGWTLLAKVVRWCALINQLNALKTVIKGVGARKLFKSPWTCLRRCTSLAQNPISLMCLLAQRRLYQQCKEKDFIRYLVCIDSGQVEASWYYREFCHYCACEWRYESILVVFFLILLILKLMLALMR